MGKPKSRGNKREKKRGNKRRENMREKRTRKQERKAKEEKKEKDMMKKRQRYKNKKGQKGKEERGRGNNLGKTENGRRDINEKITNENLLLFFFSAISAVSSFDSHLLLLIPYFYSLIYPFVIQYLL